jgi:hypothetical protein
MTPDERKRGLRAAVLAKWRRIGSGQDTDYDCMADLLWTIIDSLVDECEELRSAGAKESQ